MLGPLLKREERRGFSPILEWKGSGRFGLLQELKKRRGFGHFQEPEKGRELGPLQELKGWRGFGPLYLSWTQGVGLASYWSGR